MTKIRDKLDCEQSLVCSKICEQEYLSSEVVGVARVQELCKGEDMPQTCAFASRTTLLLKHSHLQIFEQKRDYLQSRDKSVIFSHRALKGYYFGRKCHVKVTISIKG